MTVKRPIAAISLTGVVPGAPPTAAPELTWLDPSEIVVDEAYQRNLSERSVKLIRKIIAEFDWRRFKPPTVTWTDDGLECLDGQHSLIAACSHPMIDKVPVVVVETAATPERAGAFVGINRDRLNLTRAQLHAAAVVAGDEAALAIEAVCARAGVRMRKAPPGGRTEFAARDTVAVHGIDGMIHRCGQDLAVEILRILAEADLAPISAVHLRATELLVVDEEFVSQFDPSELTKAIVALRHTADTEAKTFAAIHCVPLWRALAATWFKKVKKRKSAPATEPGNPGTAAMGNPMTKTTPAAAAASRPRAPAPPVRLSGPPLVRHLDDGRVDLGDPAPGRSALDQRRAERAER